MNPTMNNDDKMTQSRQSPASSPQVCPRRDRLSQLFVAPLVGLRDIPEQLVDVNLRNFHRESVLIENRHDVLAVSSLPDTPHPLYARQQII